MGTSLLQLEPSTRAAYRRALAQLSLEGIRVTTTSTRRTKAEQQVLFDRALAGRSAFPVARPGTSTHELGIAVDLEPKNPADLPRVVRVLEIFSFVWAGASDRVHFTYRGPRAAAAVQALCRLMDLPLAKGFELC